MASAAQRKSKTDPTETDSKESAQEKAKRLLDGATDVLEAVDQAQIFQQRDTRDFPTFQRSEVRLAERKLGSGGFGIVYTVEEFTLASESSTSVDQSNDDESPSQDAAENPPQGTDDAEAKHSDPVDYKLLQDLGEVLGLDRRRHEADGGDEHGDAEMHYDVESARGIMKERCIRMGQARYALKHLRDDLDEVDRVRGMIDLAIEISYLKVLWHPNIIKMRGVSDTVRVSPDTFLILDRLFGTLDDKLDDWRQMYEANKGGSCICGRQGRNEPALQQLMRDRLLVAYDLTQAFRYLHSHRLLYRDIKPENFGFDVRGDVKVFDFGLARSMEEKDAVKGYGFQLTKLTGSVPYMAPEVALGKPYAHEADVFSLSIVLWEMLSLKWAFNGYYLKEYVKFVVRGNERPPVNASWPAIIRTIIAEAWDVEPQKRPGMKRFGTLLRGVLENISPDDEVVNRTQHMLNRSRRSFRFRASSLRSPRHTIHRGDEQ